MPLLNYRSEKINNKIGYFKPFKLIDIYFYMWDEIPVFKPIYKPLKQQINNEIKTIYK